MPSDEIQRHLQGLAESASIIDQMIAQNDRDEIYLEVVRNNIVHITVMCDRSDIKDSGADLTGFIEAKRRGIIWIA